MLKYRMNGEGAFDETTLTMMAGMEYSVNNIVHLLNVCATAMPPLQTLALKKLAALVLQCTDSQLLIRSAQVLASFYNVTGYAGMQALRYIFQISPASRQVIVENVLRLDNSTLILHVLKQLGGFECAEHGKCIAMNLFRSSLKGDDLLYYEKNHAILDKFLANEIEMEKQDSSVLPEPEQRIEYLNQIDINCDVSHYDIALSTQQLDSLNEVYEDRLVYNIRELVDYILPFENGTFAGRQVLSSERVVLLGFQTLQLASGEKRSDLACAALDLLCNLLIFGGRHFNNDFLKASLALISQYRVGAEQTKIVFYCVMQNSIDCALQFLSSNPEFLGCAKEMINTNLLFADFQFEKDATGRLARYQALFHEQYLQLLNIPYLVFGSPYDTPTCLFAAFLDAMLYKNVIYRLLKDSFLDKPASDFFAELFDVEFGKTSAALTDYVSDGSLDGLLNDIQQSEGKVRLAIEALFPQQQMEILELLYRCLKHGDITFLRLLYSSSYLRQLKDNIMLYQAKQRDPATSLLVLQQFVYVGAFYPYHLRRQLGVIGRYFSNGWMICAEVLLYGGMGSDFEQQVLSFVLSYFESSTTLDVRALVAEDRVSEAAEVPFLFAGLMLYLKIRVCGKYALHYLSLEAISSKHCFVSDVDEELLASVSLYSEAPFEQQIRAHAKRLVDFRPRCTYFRFPRDVCVFLREYQAISAAKAEVGLSSGPSADQAGGVPNRPAARLNYFAGRRENATAVQILVQTYCYLHVMKDKALLIEQFIELLNTGAPSVKVDSELIFFMARLLNTERSPLIIEKALEAIAAMLKSKTYCKAYLGKLVSVQLFFCAASPNKAIRFISVQCINYLLNLTELLAPSLDIRSNTFASALLEALSTQQTREAALQWITRYLAPNVTETDIPPNYLFKKVKKQLQVLLLDAKVRDLANDVFGWMQKHFAAFYSGVSSPAYSRPSTPIKMKSRSGTPVVRESKTTTPRVSYQKILSQERLQISGQQSFFDRTLRINIFAAYEKSALLQILTYFDGRFTGINTSKMLQLVSQDFDRLKYVADVVFLLARQDMDACKADSGTFFLLVKFLKISELNQSRYMNYLLLIVTFELLSVEKHQNAALELIEQLKSFVDDQFILFGLQTYDDPLAINLLLTFARDLLQSAQLCSFLLIWLLEHDVSDTSLKNCIINTIRERLKLTSKEEISSYFGQGKADRIHELIFGKQNVFTLYPALKLMDYEVSGVFERLDSCLSREMQTASAAYPALEYTPEQSDIENQALLLSRDKQYDEAFAKRCRQFFETVRAKREVFASPVTNTALLSIVEGAIFCRVADYFEVLRIMQDLHFAVPCNSAIYALDLAFKVFNEYELVFVVLVNQVLEFGAEPALQALLDSMRTPSASYEPGRTVAKRIFLTKLVGRQIAEQQRTSSFSEFETALQLVDDFMQQFVPRDVLGVGRSDIELIERYRSELQQLCRQRAASSSPGAAGVY